MSQRNQGHSCRTGVMAALDIVDEAISALQQKVSQEKINQTKLNQNVSDVTKCKQSNLAKTAHHSKLVNEKSSCSQKTRKHTSVLVHSGRLPNNLVKNQLKSTQVLSTDQAWQAVNKPSAQNRSERYQEDMGSSLSKPATQARKRIKLQMSEDVGSGNILKKKPKRINQKFSLHKGTLHQKHYAQQTLSSKLKTELVEKHKPLKENILPYIPVGSQGKSYNWCVKVQQELGKAKMHRATEDTEASTDKQVHTEDTSRLRSQQKPKISKQDISTALHHIEKEILETTQNY